MTKPARLVRERIDPRLTAALFANYRTPVDAILELVDNAVDSRVDGTTLEVDLVVRPGTVILTVGRRYRHGTEGAGAANTCAGARRARGPATRSAGTARAARRRSGTWARGSRSSPAAPETTGAHGFADEDYRDRSELRTYELHERPKPVAADLGYVRIEIGGVDRKVDARRLRARLAETYRPLLERGEAGHAPGPRAVVTAPRGRSTSATRSRSGRAAGSIHGWWGLLPDPLPLPRPRPAYGSTTWGAWSGRRSGSGTRGRPSTRRSTGWSARWSCRTSR